MPGQNEQDGQTAALTCDCDQRAKELDQGEHEGDAEITREREDEGVTVRFHRVLGREGKMKEKQNVKPPPADAATSSGLHAKKASRENIQLKIKHERSALVGRIHLHILKRTRSISCPSAGALTSEQNATAGPSPPTQSRPVSM